MWKAEGWRRRGHTWWFVGEHGFAWVDLQRSQWNQEELCRFRLNTGVFFPALVALSRGAHHSALPALEPSVLPAKSASNGAAMSVPGAKDTWWVLNAQTDYAELGRRICEFWAAHEPTAEQVTDLGWQSESAEREGLFEQAAEYALSMGDLDRATALWEAHSLDEWACRVQLSEERGAGAAEPRGFISYSNHHRWSRLAIAARWERATRFAQAVTDVRAPTQVRLGVVERPAFAVPRDRKFPAEVVAGGFRPTAELARRAWDRLGPAELDRRESDSGMPRAEWSWTVVDRDRCEELVEWVLDADDTVEIQLSATYVFRWRVDGKVLPHQDARSYLRDYSIPGASELHVDLHEGTVNVDFHFPMEQKSDAFEHLWAAVGEAFEGKLTRSKLRRQVLNRGATAYRVCKL